MARFVIAEPLLPAPDATTLASLKRRNIASDAALDPTPLVGLDKPSNTSFIPPEYFGVNCIVCSGATYGFSLTRSGSGVVEPGQNVDFIADASWSYCQHTQYYEDAGWVNWPHPFSHVISVNGNYVSTLYSSGYEDYEQTNGEYLEFGLTFASGGTKTVEDVLRCEAGCPNNIFLAQAQSNVQVCTDPYAFHNPIWTSDTPLSHVTKSGAMSGGTLGVQVKVYTSTQLKFDWFQAYVTSRWNTTVAGNGVTLAISVSLQRVASAGEADLQVDYPPSSPLNPTNPEVCGYHESGATPHSIVVYADGDGQGCDEATTSAHEYGHHLGFRDAYTQPPPTTLHCDQSDIMSWGNMVQWYHGRILWERY
jgi:hypothetical protein